MDEKYSKPVVYETRSKIWDHIEGNRKSTPEKRTTTARSNHREKKERTENSIVNLEEPIKSISPLSHSSIPAWSIYPMIKRRKPETQTTRGIASNKRLNSTRRQRIDLISHGIRFFSISKEEMKEKDRVERIRGTGLSSTSSQYRIDGQCRYWRWHVLKHTPFIGAHVSVSMSVFRRRFLPTCLPRRDIRVVLPRCTVCRANRAHRKKFWPVETRNFDEFFFFFIFDPDTCHFWFGSESSIDPIYFFTPILFNNLRK